MKRFSLILLLIAVFSFGMAPLTIAAEAASRPSLSSVSPVPQEEKEKEAEPTEAKSEEATEKKDATDEKKPDQAAGGESAAKEKQSDASEKKEAGTPKESGGEKTEAKSDAKPEAKPEAAKRKTHKVEPKRLKVQVPLDGIFVARKMTEVPLRPEAWTGFEIEEVVEHGEKVREGETLFQFDDEKLNQAIEDLELEQRLNELAIRRSEEELPRMEKQLKMDFDLAERSNREAREDYDRYNDIDRPQIIKSAEFMVKYYSFMLDYEKDELDQLEKMYAADDLTEETEEVVLKRQRNSVEFAEYSLENAVIRRDETLKVMLPRYDIAIKESLERAELALARARTALAVDLNRARYELEQRKQARTKSLDRHAKLLEDRGLMEIESPAEGIVYYGQCVNGRWGETPQLINKYKPHGTVSPGSILMTIVEQRPVYIKATVDEGKRPDVATGQKATIALPAEGADRLTADVKTISAIPVSQGKFEIEFELPQDKIPDWVVAGMSCKIQVKTYDNKEALTVPKAAVRDDEDDENKKYVWVVDPDDAEAKPERRNVTVGKRSGDDVEIVKGLKAGDVVSLEDESKKADS